MIPAQILSLVDESALKEILANSVDKVVDGDIIKERLVEDYILDIGFGLIADDFDLLNQNPFPEWWTTWWNNGEFLGPHRIHSDILDYAKTL
jgi:hypothetical protein